MSTPKKTEKEKKITSAMVACQIAGFAYEALSPEVQKKVDALSAELEGLTKFFAPKVLEKITDLLFSLAYSDEVTVKSEEENQATDKK